MLCASQMHHYQWNSMNTTSLRTSDSLSIKVQSLSTTLSTGRTEVRGWSTGVTGAVSASDLDVRLGVGADTRGRLLRSWALVLGLVEAVEDYLFCFSVVRTSLAKSFLFKPIGISSGFLQNR